VVDEIVTGRLVLARFQELEEPEFVALATDPRVMRYVGDGRPWSRDRATQRFREHLVHWAEQGFGWRAIRDRADGRRFLGLVALNRLGAVVPDLPPDDIEIGWWIAPDAWGRGIATEAAVAARDEAFERLAVDRIAARYQPENVASGQVMRKIGMSYHGEVASPYGNRLRVCVLSRQDWYALTGK
jgi:RimJ/RimL family protein N-acetyltransferase